MSAIEFSAPTERAASSISACDADGLPYAMLSADRRLPGTGSADQSDGRARRDLQIEIGEGVDVRTRVPEPDPVEMDGAVESSGDRDQILAVGSLDRTASA